MPNPIRIKTASGWQDLALTGIQIFEQAADPGAQPAGSIWIDTDDVPPVYVSPIPLVSALPSNPVDGQEIFYLADAINGVIWHLRYRVAASGLYKWEYVGGPPLYHAVSGGTVPSSSPTVVGGGPTITVPLAGDYIANHSADLYGPINTAIFSNLFVGNTDANARIAIVRPAAATTGVMGGREVRVNGVAAGAAINARYAITSATGNMENGTLLVSPVRVG